jgi:hypothetical protein
MRSKWLQLLKVMKNCCRFVFVPLLAMDRHQLGVLGLSSDSSVNVHLLPKALVVVVFRLASLNVKPGIKRWKRVSSYFPAAGQEVGAVGQCHNATPKSNLPW